METSEIIARQILGANITRNTWGDIIVNVKVYGAVGDGVTDDTTAIQTALNVARDSGSATVYFPDGTYCFSVYLRLYANTTVIMSNNAILKQTGSANKIFINGEQGNTAYATGYDGEGNIHFHGGTIDMNCGGGRLSPTLTCSAFDLGHGADISFTNLTIINGQIGHYFQVSGCKNVRFRDCWFGDVIYSSTASANYEVLQIETLTSASFPTFGSFDDTPSTNILVENCTFDGVVRAIGSHGGVPANLSNDIRIINCTINNAYDNALNLSSYYNVIVEGCTITSTGQSAIYMTSVSDSKISNNYVNGAAECGLLMSTISGNNFLNNHFINCCTTGAGVFSVIRVTDATKNAWTGNTVFSLVPSYARPFFIDGTSTGNRITNHNFTNGLSGGIGGVSPNFQDLIIGNGQVLLFDGDLDVVGETGTLSTDIREFNYLLVVATDNVGAAHVMSAPIPKTVYTTGATTERFRILLDNIVIPGDLIDFSFPNFTSVRVDVITGTVHLKKVIGML